MKPKNNQLVFLFGALACILLAVSVWCMSEQNKELKMRVAALEGKRVSGSGEVKQPIPGKDVAMDIESLSMSVHSLDASSADLTRIVSEMAQKLNIKPAWVPFSLVGNFGFLRPPFLSQERQQVSKDGTVEIGMWFMNNLSLRLVSRDVADTATLEDECAKRSNDGGAMTTVNNLPACVTRWIEGGMIGTSDVEEYTFLSAVSTTSKISKQLYTISLTGPTYDKYCDQNGTCESNAKDKKIFQEFVKGVKDSIKVRSE